MTEYKSTFEKIKAKKILEGKYYILSESQNIKIMLELSEGMHDFDSEDKVNKVKSELELKNIIFNI